MSERLTLIRLLGVSLLWGCNYAISAYLLRDFSPIFLSFVRICMTSLFLITVALVNGGLRKPSKKEWGLLAGAGIFGTLLNQTFYFTGLHHSTAGNAALILALAPICTTILARIFLKERFNVFKVTGAIVGLAGVIIIVLFGGNSELGLSIGDLYLMGAMLTLSTSLLFIRRLTETLSSYAVTIFSTVFGSALMIIPFSGEVATGGTMISHSIWLWVLLATAGILNQGLAGFWWNQGVSVIGASRAAMFMNVQPFIALIAGHFLLGDPIYASQILGGVLILGGVAVANKKPTSKPGAGTPAPATA
ncbi:DMT family transporter [Tumebacillus sp. ITR2]|uniref:DMT family transporter n=1 Tax=Tumebacillus amylolyticus TaxID=2801339 RepID=A0ABS1JG14_9BACL|nr:DMT family transporter [Tumebacillus amylolyticus]MBL0389222.1 DMT family transporter [Tumebacillus amylolyticus]